MKKSKRRISRERMKEERERERRIKKIILRFHVLLSAVKKFYIPRPLGTCWQLIGKQKC
jgi:uncharacterized protein YfiM (DUF2279 family)